MRGKPLWEHFHYLWSAAPLDDNTYPAARADEDEQTPPRRQQRRPSKGGKHNCGDLIAQKWTCTALCTNLAAFSIASKRSTDTSVERHVTMEASTPV